MYYIYSIIWLFGYKAMVRQDVMYLYGSVRWPLILSESIFWKLKRSIQEVNILNFAVKLLILMWVWLRSIISSLLKILYMLLKLFFMLHKKNIISILNRPKKINICKLLAMRTLRYIWVTKYRTTSPDNPKSLSSKWPSLDIFYHFFTKDNGFKRDLKQVINNNEYKEYCTKPLDPFLLTLPLLQWWVQHETEYHKLIQWVLDLHSIPATLAECERVFCSERQLLTPWQNRFPDNMIKTNEYLMAWKRFGFFWGFSTRQLFVDSFFTSQNLPL